MIFAAEENRKAYPRLGWYAAGVAAVIVAALCLHANAGMTFGSVAPTTQQATTTW
jgi:hypothetical protein